MADGTKLSDAGGQQAPILTNSAAPGTGPGSGELNVVGIVALSSWVVLLSAFIGYSLVVLWPSHNPGLGEAATGKIGETGAGHSADRNLEKSKAMGVGANDGTGPNRGNSTNEKAPVADGTAEQSRNPSGIRYFGVTISVGAEIQLLLLVVLAGALGSQVHVLRSLYWYVGMRDLRWSWVLMYVLLPLNGSALALVFYFVLRGGLFPQASASETTPFGFVAIACLIGLFSQQAVLKLKDVAETLLSKPAPGADAKPQSSGTVPVRPAVIPAIALCPNQGASAGGEVVTITAVGASFSDGATVAFGQELATVQSLSSSQMTVVSPKGAPGKVDVTVIVPGAKPDKLVAEFTYK